MEDLNITTATKSQMEIAFIFNEELCNYLGGFDVASNMSEIELREKITSFIIENNEA